MQRWHQLIIHGGDGSTATTLVPLPTGDAANIQYAVYGGQATNLNQDLRLLHGCLHSDGSGFGTLTNVSVFYRIVGGNIEIQGKFQAGTVTASEGRIFTNRLYIVRYESYCKQYKRGHWWQANPTVAPGAILIEPSVTGVTWDLVLLVTIHLPN